MIERVQVSKVRAFDVSLEADSARQQTAHSARDDEEDFVAALVVRVHVLACHHCLRRTALEQLKLGFVRKSIEEAVRQELPVERGLHHHQLVAQIQVACQPHELVAVVRLLGESFLDAAADFACQFEVYFVESVQLSENLVLLVFEPRPA